MSRQPLRALPLLLALGLAWRPCLVRGDDALAPPSPADAVAPPPTADAVASRAAEGAARVTAVHERLAQAESRLLAVLRREAPDLARSFQSAGPAEPFAAGWMRLPRVVANELRPSTPVAPRSATWSWPRLREALDAQERALAAFEATLAVRASSSTRGRVSPPELVRQHEQLRAEERRVAADLRHLTFWEEALRSRWPACLEQAELHDLVVERSAATDGGAQLSADRTAEIDARLAASRPKPRVPDFVTVERPDDTTVVLRAALATDVGPQFAALFERAAEDTWQAGADGISYRLELDVQLVPRRALVQRAKELHLGKHVVPRVGEPVDLERHVSLFPPGRAVLTSGGTTTHAMVGRYVALGPLDISRRVLAHEFGHVLGFLDGYFRGCRDEGVDGLNVLEIVPDATDIMDHPTQGLVTAGHFRTLVAEIESRP